MKVAVYAVALNEAEHVERWYRSAEEADCLLICDTGSTDDTSDRISRTTIDYEEIAVSPWRFDDARNASLALVPADIDVCIALDLDETLEPGWREALERAWKPGTTRLRHPFAFKQNADGTPSDVMYGHRIHARHAYRWVYPIHEALYAKTGVKEQVAWCDDLWVYHRPKDSKSRAYYLPMLATAADEYPTDARMQFYYGRELMYHCNWTEAVRQFNRYLDLEKFWREQRAEAMRYKARCLEYLGESATEHYLQATIESPLERINWLELADNRRRNEDWIGGVWAAQNALVCHPSPKGECHNVKHMTAGPYDVGGICAFYAGLKDLAREWLTRAAAMYPDDARLQENLKFITPS